ncbi:MAG TPA: hypothetical protein VKG84_13955 [Candidatus Acidoferrales bacterium]|nr:hypothetical protein [Candidatus Acidoferrales bacterium]
MKRRYSISGWIPAVLVLALAACSSNPSSSSTNSGATGGSQPPATAANPAATIVVPSGTAFTVSMASAVGSKTSHENDPFEATLAEPVVVGDKVVIPKGASASGIVTQAHPAGRFKGAATLGLSLRSVTINGQPYAIQTTIASQQSKGKGKRTAGFIGGGAAGGALIGGLAGGAKGMGIGALVGAGAGTVGAAFTGNRDISIPVETLVRFSLTADLPVPQK